MKHDISLNIDFFEADIIIDLLENQRRSIVNIISNIEDSVEQAED
jgi:hypothetical protein